jgi:hypothetical protein
VADHFDAGESGELLLGGHAAFAGGVEVAVDDLNRLIGAARRCALPDFA